MRSIATAVWKGNLKEGAGTISSNSGVLSKTPYSFSMRFEDEQGTTPEELIASAHAGCFSMALSMILGDAGFTADSLKTTSVVTLGEEDGDFNVTQSELALTANIDGIDQETFEKLANKAKNHCPISKLINAKITLKSVLQ